MLSEVDNVFLIKPLPLWASYKAQKCFDFVCLFVFWN